MRKDRQGGPMKVIH